MTIGEAVVGAPAVGISDGAPRQPLLFLIADTGGGHRAAAGAVAEALEWSYPGRFAPELCDPLGGPDAAPLLRRIAGCYGPLTRWVPWLWGAVYYAFDSRLAMGVLRQTVLAPADGPVAAAVKRHHPAAVVSFHPLLAQAAVNARPHSQRPLPVVTVVTDLMTAHSAWRVPRVDRVVAPSGAFGGRGHADGLVEIGMPVGPAFRAGPPGAPERKRLRRALGVDDNRFLVVLTGGGEGSGGLARQAAAIVSRFDDVHVVAICGRNRGGRRRLTRLADHAAGRAGSGGHEHGRLTVHGFVDNMGEWLGAADLVVAKAGPGTIAEATCCGAPLLLTSHLPGQEKGNAEFVVAGGAGRQVRGRAQLLSTIDDLRRDPATLDGMRSASGRLGRPQAAGDIAAFLAGVVDDAGPLPAPAPAGFIDNPLSGERIRVRLTGRETAGQLVSWDLFLAPGGRVPSSHAHPRQEERFTVVAGVMRFRTGRRTRTVTVGETVVVPPGTVHHFANAGPDTARLVVEARPALDLESFLRTAAAMARQQHAKGRALPNLLHLALLMDEFTEEARSPRLPRLVARVARLVARWARARGLDAGYRNLR